jgi:hypothetical protein
MRKKCKHFSNTCSKFVWLYFRMGFAPDRKREGILI